MSQPEPISRREHTDGEGENGAAAPVRTRPPAGRRTASARPAMGPRAAATRGRLLEAAIQVFERDGYANATVDDIVAAASARRATFYLHYSSKRDVIYEILEELSGASYMVVNPPVHREVTFASVRAWFDEVAAYWHEHRARLAVMEDAAVNDREIRALVDGSRRTSIDLLAGWIRDAGSDPDPRLRAMMLHSELRALLFLTIVNGWAWDEERALDLLAERWFAALQPPR